MAKPDSVVLRVQLLVEGNDQVNFFEAFADHLSLDHVQLQNYGGVNELRSFIPALASMSGFHTVESVGIVRDAEESARSAFHSVQSSLKRAGLTVPDHPLIRSGTSPAVNVLILPGDNRDGMLETLLCDSFANTRENNCINSFFKCIEAADIPPAKLPDKARAFAYLTTKQEPRHSVGVAAKRGYWDLDHNAFDNVRRFLNSL